MEVQNVVRTKDLKWFLIKRFLFIMMFIFISEELLNMVYRLWIGPFLIETLHIRQLSVTTGDGSVMLLALQMLLLSVSAFLPKAIAGWVQAIIGKNMGGWLHVDIDSPILDGVTNRGMIKLYYASVIIIFLVLLLLTLFPYLVSAYWYYRAVSKKVYELLLAEKSQKEAYDKQRNLMLSDIAHDIKTPITTICGYARAISDNVVSDEEKKQEYLQSIYTKSMRMDELINLLLEYVQLDSSGFELHKEKADLGEMLRENIALMYSDFEENNMKLEIDIPEQKFPYEMDKIQMGRAVVNILTNAVKYNGKGTKLSISLCADMNPSGSDDNIDTTKDNIYQIRIADDGASIDETLAEHIFEPFSRGDSSRNSSGGSGLGLSISSKIVQMHGGKLLLERKCEDGYVKAFLISLKRN
ncbi:MAG: HAMP domain-containing histidine kinase [Lachnospiraceae bacterium]|nr:HAMP domain-containing histidine kinase [Lachnospiraceae bacterium]